MTLNEVNSLIYSKGNRIEVHISLVQDKGYTIAKINGMIDTYNSVYVNDVLSLIIQLDGIKKFVIDLKEVNYISSTGIGLFVDILKKCKLINVEFYLFGVIGKIKEIFELLGFINFFNLIDDFNDIKNYKKDLFPLNVSCPSCSKKYKVQKIGGYKCSICQTSFSVNNDGTIKIK